MSDNEAKVDMEHSAVAVVPSTGVSSKESSSPDKPLPEPPDTEDHSRITPHFRVPKSSSTLHSPSGSVAERVGSMRSETSTIAYQQLPFAQFSSRVEELCQLLWPSSTREMRAERLFGGSSSRLVGALRNTKFRKLLPALASKDVMIERLEGGTYNRITGITVPKAVSVDPERLILRTPRIEWECRPDRDVAILRYIRKHTAIPVPEVKHFDFTRDNPLKQPYVLQSRLPGYSLQRVYPNLTHEENCTVARELGKIILGLQEVHSPYPGLIENGVPTTDPDVFNIKPFDIKTRHDKEWKMKPQDHVTWTNDKYERRYGTTIDFLITQFGRWRAHELQDDPSGIVYWNYQHRFVETAQAMDRLGIFGDKDNCLCHLDFAARNILVDIPAEGPLTISGVLDWDSAIFAPVWVCCAPPWWIWADDPEDDGADWDEQDESRALVTPPTAKGQEMKRIFEETVGEDYLEYAYKPQYRLARKLFHFAVNGLHQNEDVANAEKLFTEWQELYDKSMQQAMEEMAEEEQGDTGLSVT